MSTINVEALQSDRITAIARQYDIDANGARVEVTQQNQVITIRKVDQLHVGAVNKGPKGDKGDQGNPAPSYVFTQDVPANEWVIAHNLGFYPAVFTYSVGGVEMVGSVINLSLNELRVMFEIPVAGTARLN